MLSFQRELPAIFTPNRLRRDDYVRTVHDLFNLDWGDVVAQDVTDVSGVPIEALDLVGHVFSIYDLCIYAIADRL